MKTVLSVSSLVLVVGFVAGCTSGQDQPIVAGQTQSDPNAAKDDGTTENPPFKKRVHKDGKGIIGKTTNEIVDFHKALAENPKLKIIENKISGGDPITQSMTAYMALSSKISIMNFQHDVDIARNFGDGSPLSYEDIVKRMKIHGIELTMLYAWQKYAYNAKKGEIVILEDPELKAKILKQ